MTNAPFTKTTKQAALKRAKNQCEATGAMYGLPADQRCANSLGHGVEFDHIILDANSRDNSLSNCAAVCIPCHRYKTRHHDIPLAAKTVRQGEKAIFRHSSNPMPGSRASNWKKPMGGGPAVRRT